MRMRLLALVLAVACPLPAAGQCHCPLKRTYTSDGHDVTVSGVPRNLRIRASDWIVDPKAESFVLRDKEGRFVPLELKLKTAGDGMLVLAPKKPLAPNATYEFGLKGKKGFDAWATYVTGAEEDAKAPYFQDVKSVRLLDPPLDAFCRSYREYVELELEQVRKDSEDERVDFAVWVDKPDGPPYFIVPLTEGKLRLGGPSQCDAHWIPMEKIDRIRLFIAAVDRAGNMGPKREVEFGAAPGTGRRNAPK